MKYFIASTSLFALSLVSLEAHAKVRSCRAGYYAVIRIVNGEYIPPSNFVGLPALEFTTKGTCGPLHGDLCRERARRDAENCMYNHWTTQITGTPTICLPRPSDGLGVQNYPVINVREDVRREICKRYSRGTALSINVHAFVASWSHSKTDGCYSDFLLNRDFMRFTC